MAITPAGPDKSSVAFRETKASDLRFPRPSDQRCDKDRLVKEWFLKPMMRRTPVAMRVEVYLRRSQRLVVQNEIRIGF